MTYRELLNKLELRKLNLNHLNNQYSFILSNLRSELSYLQNFEKKNMDSLIQYFVMSLGKPVDNFKDTVSAFNIILGRPLTTEISDIKERMHEFKKTNSALEFINAEILVEQEDLDKAILRKKDANNKFNEFVNLFSVIDEALSIVEKVKNLIENESFTVADCKKVGFFGQMLLSNKMKIYLEMKELGRTIENVKELSVFDMFDEFDELVDMIQSFKSNNEDIRKEYNESRNDYAKKQQKLLTNEGMLESHQENWNDLNESLTVHSMFQSIFSKLNDADKKMIWLCYGFNIEEIKLDNTSRISFIKANIQNISKDFSKVTNVLNTVEKQIAKISHIALKHPYRNISNYVEMDVYQNKIEKIEYHYKKKYDFHNCNYTRYSNLDLDCHFSSMDALLRVVVFDALTNEYDTEIANNVFEAFLSDDFEAFDNGMELEDEVDFENSSFLKIENDLDIDFPTIEDEFAKHQPYNQNIEQNNWGNDNELEARYFSDSNYSPEPTSIDSSSFD